MVPLSLQRGKYVISFYFPLFKQSGINYPPTSSVPLSFKKGASFLMLSFNQLSHAYPLQEENIPLYSCNLQGLHGPENPIGFLQTYEPRLIPTCESSDSHRQQIKFTALRTFRCTPQRHKKRQEKFLPLFRCLKGNYPDFRSDCLKEN